MVKIKINMSIGELMIEFTDTSDLENQLKNIDLVKIESLLATKIHCHPHTKEFTQATPMDTQIIELGTVNLLRVSEGGQDATKLAIFLSANKMNPEDVKKITGITIRS
ncbi:hypothetical protein [Candidatus Nitrosotalea okcheonensis]|uniref:Uncharacterized protein n=1 Tax=Candidatus Nitrosotalea okcheonensis TaxID=1903276 RepID=A0A2H1FFT0_9ARCH|nr:hypothetical protein [Candidatus Nitrosotalea okcheonensis]SMH71635.1 protein of unknown function [Candidatus Nitrosotalea okcheonensis]